MRPLSPDEQTEEIKVWERYLATAERDVEQLKGRIGTAERALVQARDRFYFKLEGAREGFDLDEAEIDELLTS